MGRWAWALAMMGTMAIWEIWGKGVYQYVLQQRGLTYDFPTAFLGYAIPIGGAWILSWWIGRRG